MLFILFSLTDSVGDVFKVTIEATPGEHNPRVWIQILDRHDGSYIVRYKLFQSSTDLRVNVKLQDEHVGGSPFKLYGRRFFHNSLFNLCGNIIIFPSNMSNAAFEIRPFRLSETTKLCGRQSIVTMRPSRQPTFEKDIFTLIHYYLKAFISQVSDCQN